MPRLTNLIGTIINAPSPFSGKAEIVGSRYYTSRNNGRTSFVFDYVMADGKTDFDTIENIARNNPELLAHLKTA